MKYLLFRSFGELDRRINEHELVAVEYGRDIEDATKALIAAAKEDLAGLPEYKGCAVNVYAPKSLATIEDVEKYDYEMEGVVSPPNAPENILIDYGIVEETE